MSAKIRFPSYSEVTGLKLGSILVTGYVLIWSMVDGTHAHIRVVDAMKVNGFRRLFKRPLRRGWAKCVIAIDYDWYIAVDRDTLVQGFASMEPNAVVAKLARQSAWSFSPLQDLIASLIDKAYFRDSSGRFL